MGAEMACQVRVKLENDMIVPVRQFASSDVSLKRQWARNLFLNLLTAVPNTPECLAIRKAIRPLDFSCHLDGSVTEVSSCKDEGPSTSGNNSADEVNGKRPENSTDITILEETAYPATYPSGHLDGSITVVSSCNDKGPSTSGNNSADEVNGKRSENSTDITILEETTYPLHYQLPDVVVRDLDLKEKIGRKELFAAGCLMYEILAGEPPLAGLTANEAQARFARGELPDPLALDKDVGTLILGAWNVDFYRRVQEKLTSQGPELNNASILTRAKTYVIQNPKRFVVQASGLGLWAASFTACPLLHLVGFGALGPVAGSAAAAWQSHIGIVSAQSLFALLQSAGMGGAVAGTITTVGWAGLGTAGLATVPDVRVLIKQISKAEEGIDVMDVFRKVWREGEKGKVQ